LARFAAAIHAHRMFTAPAPLPDDPTILQRLLFEAMAEIERLRLRIAGLERARFGRRSEQLCDMALQQESEELEQSLAEQSAKLEAVASALKTPGETPTPETAPAPKRNRGALPPHLPRIEVIVDIEDKTCPCCGGGLHVIGEDRAEMLDYIPARFQACPCEGGGPGDPPPAIRLPGLRGSRGSGPRAGASHRRRHACPCEGGGPRKRCSRTSWSTNTATICRSTASPRSSPARLAPAKAGGVTLDRSTLSNWVGRACWWLAPLHELMLSTVLSSPRVFADDTTLPVLDPGAGKTKTGRLWCCAVDNRPWQGPGHPAAAYVYSENRKAEHPAIHLKGFRGLLQTDGYAGFIRLATPDDAIKLVFCWAHARRKFHDIHAATKSPLAEEALLRIAALYTIEIDINGQSAEERQRVRQENSRPLVDAMHVWLNERLERISGRSALAQAIRYALNHWEGLTLFLSDGRVELDTNTVERAMRPVALGRKNALFAGSDSGARHWAIIATLIQTAKLNEVDPLAWLTDVLERIVSGRTKQHQLDTLLPWNWKAEREATNAGTG
jgi:transposase